MRQLLPHAHDEVDPLEVYGAVQRPPTDDRPWVMANMVASTDGATALDGVSGALGGDGDRAVFAAVRTIADVILVASATANAERYGPARLTERRAAWRKDRGKPTTPTIAVVTSSLGLDRDLPMFDDHDGPRPMILTVSDSPTARRDELCRCAEIVDIGTGRVDLGAALQELRDRGADVVLAEGGPSLLGQLAAIDAIDELCLTIAPVLAGGDSHNVVRGAPPAARPLELSTVLEQDGELFLRYVRPST